LFYLSTLAPTVTAEDSGELITASYFLGIPHPPGYPTWCLLSHPFVYIPFGSIAWRVNLSSAFFASCTVLFVFLVGYRLSKSRVAAISSALLFAFSLEFWEQSVITEVYALNACSLVLCFYLLCLWKETYNAKYLLWLSFSMG
jgi:4-amino-4-deoxy-L-arabinose transferase-like glycosyltransferase